MKINQKVSGRAVSMPAGLLNGLGVSAGVTVLGAVITAKLLDAGKIELNSVGYAIMIILLAASFLGSLCSQKRIKRQYLAVSVLSGVVFFMTLISSTALFFGGQYEAVLPTGILIMGGSVLTLFISTRQNRGFNRRKKRVGNR